MRATLSLVLLVAVSLPAQGTLTTHYAANYYLHSNAGGVYFDLEVHRGVLLEQIDLNLRTPFGSWGQVEVWIRPQTWVGHVEENVDWVLAGSGGVVAIGYQQPSVCELHSPIGLPPGGYGVALRVLGAMPAYRVAPAPQTYGNAELTLTGGGSAVSFLASRPFAIRVFSGALHYTLENGLHSLGTVTEFGVGCNRRARSFYEQFTAGPVDLANRRLVLRANAVGGYDVKGEAGAVAAPPSHASNLALSRGGAAVVPLAAPLPFPGGSTSALLVHADGRVMLTDDGPLGSGPVSPLPAMLFAAAPTIAVAWQDYAPGPTANVYCSVDQLTGAVTITWWRLPIHGAPGKVGTFSFTACVDGSLLLCLDTVDNPGRACLVGFASGPDSLDPGPRDLSALPFGSAADDSGLGLAARGRPVLGSRMTLSLTNCGQHTILAAIGFATPSAQNAIDLGPLGAPGCLLHLDLASMVWRWPGPAREVHPSFPTDTALVGVRIDAQAALWQPEANALGLVTSNGLALRIGTI